MNRVDSRFLQHCDNSTLNFVNVKAGSAAHRLSGELYDSVYSESWKPGSWREESGMSSACQGVTEAQGSGTVKVEIFGVSSSSLYILLAREQKLAGCIARGVQCVVLIFSAL